MSYADDGQFPEVVLTYLLKPNRWSRDRDGSDDGILVEIGAATDETYSRKLGQEQVSYCFSDYR
ncbi:hypothetical protein [Halocatena marina]|uniref:Transposase n=1 Tax=Halocatena marina TaxID=2934937 RepID=A0ABD5YY21_9EURY|nr:hypothetical protein [Halocatena marina]